MDKINFKINGIQYSVGSEVPAETSLASYLRYHAQLTGTKTMCREGGCGACILTVAALHPVSNELHTFSVNACLVLVFSCEGWEITTVEGIGNRHQGYHPIQHRLTQLHGTQCGYCTPGWIGQMYSLLGKKLTMVELENSFGSNTCRCTGYRSILDTMKTFAVDATPELLSKIKDIEDVPTFCTKKNIICNKKCSESDSNDWCLLDVDERKNDLELSAMKKISFKDKQFYVVEQVEDIFSIFEEEGTSSYMLIAGNTGKGIYETFDYPDVLIDISRIEELRTHQVGSNLSLGANMPLEEVKELFINLAKTNDQFLYLEQLASHIDLVAHIPVRNIGTLAGNLMLKNKTNLFSSDIFLLLATAGAKLTIRSANGVTEEINMETFLKFDMKGKIIYRVTLPSLGKDYVFRSYKIMPRNQNAHAIVNAGFLLRINNNIIKSSTIVFGAINGDFIHATKTERYIKFKNIFYNRTLQGAIKILAAELNPVENPPEPSPDVRKKLAIGLFYKMVLNLCPENKMNSRYISGGEKLERGLSSGTQIYETDSTLFPINEPLPKLEGLIQCSGEALYANDLPSYADQVFAAFVLTTVHSGEIDTIDQTDILEMEGVLAVYTAKDLPGINRFIRPLIKIQTHAERILVDGKIKYYGEPLAIVVADTEERATTAAKLVKVTYKNLGTTPPLLEIEDAKKILPRVFPSIPKIPRGRGIVIDKHFTGTFKSGRQYHYTMETQTCVTLPMDNGIEVHSATQWIQITHIAVSEALNIPLNQVHVIVRRVGGAYGCKVSRPAQIAAACALVTKLRNVPCRFVLPLQTNMSAIGKRAPCLAKYSVGCTEKGKIQYVDLDLCNGDGCTHDELYITYLATDSISNCYDDAYWGCFSSSVLTDEPSQTIMRAPGTTEATAICEQIMEQIAFELQIDPLEVKLINMRDTDNSAPELIDEIIKDSDYKKRLLTVKEFNKNNRWMKKAMRISCVDFSLKYFGNFTAYVTIFEGDGTVIINSGGIDAGQGLTTKSVQACAKTLEIPVEYVNIENNNSTIGGNDVFSANSVTSEIICHCIIEASKVLKDRIAPYKLGSVSWKEAVAAAAKDQVNLSSEYQFSKFDLGTYINQGVAVCEIQVDLLTGQHQILRVDMLQDTGVSINPLMDLGQIEGAYVQGLGYWLSERLVNDPKTGRLYTNRSWNYHVPLAKDIPIEFNVKFRANNINKKGVTGSKAVAEITLCLANGAILAIRECIHESRSESGYNREWIEIVPPYDVETVLYSADTKIEEFLIN